MSAPNVKDLQDQGRAVMIVSRPDLAGDDGDISLMQLDEAVAMADVVLGIGGRDVGATYLDGAKDDKLALLADDQFDTQKQEESPAIGQVSFTNTGSVSGTISAGTRVATAADEDGEFQEFTTDVDLVFASETGPKTVAATASVAGRDGNVAASKVTRILDTLFDANFSVTNAAKFVGGAPAEDDESLRARARGYKKKLRRGTKEAIELGIVDEVLAVKNATGVEDTANQTGTLYVSDADGNSNAEMISDVEDELPNWRAFGVPIPVVGSTLVSQAVVVSLTVRTGVDAATLVLRVRQAIVAYINRLKAGETLKRELIWTAAKNVDRDAITNVTITTPAADVDPEDNELIRTTLAQVTAT